MNITHRPQESWAALLDADPTCKGWQNTSNQKARRAAMVLLSPQATASQIAKVLGTQTYLVEAVLGSIEGQPVVTEPILEPEPVLPPNPEPEKTATNDIAPESTEQLTLQSLKQKATEIKNIVLAGQLPFDPKTLGVLFLAYTHKSSGESKSLNYAAALEFVRKQNVEGIVSTQNYEADKTDVQKKLALIAFLFGMDQKNLMRLFQGEETDAWNSEIARHERLLAAVFKGQQSIDISKYPLADINEFIEQIRKGAASAAPNHKSDPVNDDAAPKRETKVEALKEKKPRGLAAEVIQRIVELANAGTPQVEIARKLGVAWLTVRTYWPEGVDKPKREKKVKAPKEKKPRGLAADIIQRIADLAKEGKACNQIAAELNLNYHQVYFNWPEGVDKPKREKKVKPLKEKKPHGLAADVVQRIAELAIAGNSIQGIADELRVAWRTVRTHWPEGVDKPKREKKVKALKEKKPRGLAANVIQRITELAVAGKTQREIARELKTTPQTVRKYWPDGVDKTRRGMPGQKRKPRVAADVVQRIAELAVAGNSLRYTARELGIAKQTVGKYWPEDVAKPKREKKVKPPKEKKPHGVAADKVEAIEADARSGMSVKNIAKKYGVSIWTIYDRWPKGVDKPKREKKAKLPKERKRRGLAAEVIQRIVELANAGTPQVEIARKLGVAWLTVRTYWPEGLDRPRRGMPGQKRKPRVAEDVIQRIAELVRAGKTQREIARELKTTTPTVRKYWPEDVAKPKRKKKVTPPKEKKPRGLAEEIVAGIDTDARAGMSITGIAQKYGISSASVSNRWPEGVAKPKPSVPKGVSRVSQKTRDGIATLAKEGKTPRQIKQLLKASALTVDKYWPEGVDKPKKEKKVRQPKEKIKTIRRARVPKTMAEKPKGGGNLGSNTFDPVKQSALETRAALARANKESAAASVAESRRLAAAAAQNVDTSSFATTSAAFSTVAKGETGLKRACLALKEQFSLSAAHIEANGETARGLVQHRINPAVAEKAKTDLKRIAELEQALNVLSLFTPEQDPKIAANTLMQVVKGESSELERAHLAGQFKTALQTTRVRAGHKLPAWNQTVEVAKKTLELLSTKP